jgi:hypothetical protein
MADGFAITTDTPLTDEQRAAIIAAGSRPENLEHLKRNRAADSTEPLTMMGAQYKLCEGVHLPPVSLGTVYALALIDSPFVTEAPEATTTDIMNAVYILANGRAAIQPIFGLQWQLRAFRRVEHIAAKSPELFAVYLDRLTTMSRSAEALDRAALAWWDSLPEMVPMNYAAELVEMAIIDAYSFSECFPDTGGSQDVDREYASPAWSPEQLGTMLKIANSELGLGGDDRVLWMPLASLGYQIVAKRGENKDANIGRTPSWGSFLRAVKAEAGIVETAKNG